MDLTESLNKVFSVLELIIGKEELTDFRNENKDDLPLYHLGAGIWVRNNLLKETGTLYQLFIENNITEKDDMSSQIIAQFHEYLSKKV